MAVKYAPHTSTSAAARAKAKVGKSNRVGYCAEEVIPGIFGIAAPWRFAGNGKAWAVNYFKGAQKVVKTSDPAKIPAGAMVFFDARPGATTNGGKAGHVAVGAGSGYIYSTDLPTEGKWGKVKITDVTRLWGKKLLGYVLIDGMGYTLTDKPKAKPKPPVTWFNLGQWSLPGFDEVYGKKHWNSLEQGIVNEIKRLNCAVWGLTEIPEPRRASMAAKFEKAGHHLVVSDNGRSIVVKNGVKVGRTKIVTLKDKGPAKDDKQIVMAELWPTGSGNAIVLVVGHLEHRLGAAYDKTRVAQGKQERTEGLTWAKDTCHVPSSRVFFADDENSVAQVLDEAYEPTFVDVFSTAHKRSNADDATICGWDGKTSKGPRTDKVKAHKTRPIGNATVSTATAKKKLSDHVPNKVVVGQI